MIEELNILQSITSKGQTVKSGRKIVTSNEPASRGVWLMRGLLLEEYILILQFI